MASRVIASPQTAVVPAGRCSATSPVIAGLSPSRHTATIVRDAWILTTSDTTVCARSSSLGSLTSATSVISSVREPPVACASCSQSLASSRST